MDNNLQSQFRKSGHLISAHGVGEAELSALRTACDELLAEPVDDGGNGRHKIGLGHKRRFLAHRHEEFTEVEKFLLTGSAARLAASIFGEGCMLFNEQFVVKGPGTGASFAWHQDGAYVGFDHLPYLSVWIALDDTNVDNGCLYVLLRNLDDEDFIDPHQWDEASREMTCRPETIRGIPVECNAGSMVAFSSLTPHRSGSNVTDRPRRAYLAQYSQEPIRDPASGNLKRFAKEVTISPA